MGAIYTLICDHCGHKITTSGPWEFYRDEKGKIKPYGHPIPASAEAAERGVYGLRADMYCPKCGKIRSVILVEYKKPCHDSLEMWSGRCEEDKKEVKCPVCGSTNLILEPPEEGIRCPKCGKGTLKLQFLLIS